MDDQKVPNVKNVAVREETVRPWIEKIRRHYPRDLLHIRTQFNIWEPFTDSRALELAISFSDEHIHHLDLVITHLNPTSQGTKEFAASLETANIRHIEVHGSLTGTTTPVLGVLLAALKGHQTLSSLCLSHCGDLGDDLAALVESKPRNLTEIKLKDCALANPYNPRLLRCIGRALHDRYLTNFAFKRPDLTVEHSWILGGVKLTLGIDEALPSQCFQDLLAAYDNVRHVTLYGRTALGLVTHCSIKKISFKSTRFNLEVAHCLDTLLRSQAGSLKELELTEMNINLDCWQVLITGMALCHGLSHLHVGRAMLSVTERGPLVGCVLRSCQQITSLSFGGDLCTADVNMFAEDLRTNRTLKSLSIVGSRIDSVDALADCLGHNSCLETLKLAYTYIVDPTPLFRMLVHRQVPTDLFLPGNRFDYRGWDALSEALGRGALLRKLSSEVNPSDEADCLACIRFIRGMDSHPHLKEFDLYWNWALAPDVGRKRQLLECLISAIESSRFLEKLSLEWTVELGWDDWKDTFLAAVKQNKSLVQISVGRICDQHFKGWLNFCTLRNKVNRTLESCARGLWSDMLARLHEWPEKIVGISNVFLAFRTHPKLSEAAGRSSSTKRSLAEEV